MQQKWRRLLKAVDQDKMQETEERLGAWVHSFTESSTDVSEIVVL